MTPTLAGRIQTRAVLLAVLGVPLCFVEGRVLGDARSAVTLVAYVLVLGLIWDPFYHYAQAHRWDQDWPPWLQLTACFVEGVLLWSVLKAVPLWQEAGFTGPPGVRPIPDTAFVVHYATVWLATFAATQGPLRVLFPNWRFAGGRFR
jgi:hypothetical protein